MYAIRSRGYRTLSDVKAHGIKPPDILAWWSNGKARNTALITNDRLFVLDFDEEAQYWRFVAEMPVWANTMTVKSPNGWHCYFRTQAPITGRLISNWEGVEVKHNGDCILCPPSRIGLRWYQQVGLIKNPIMLRDATAISFLEYAKGTRRGQEGDTRRTRRDGDFSSYRAQSASILSIIKVALPISVYVSQWLEGDLTKSGEGYWLTHCPFHDDHKPSFWINDAEGICNCFKPGCQAEKPMDLLDLYQRLNCCTLREAIREMATELGF